MITNVNFRAQTGAYCLARIYLFGQFLLAGSNGFAQARELTPMRPIQVSLGYPIGSNGVQATQYTNRFSLNLLYGVNRGVTGVELGSILNINKGHVSGLQLAGVANSNAGGTSGLQLAGIANLNQGPVWGMQLAAVSNIDRAEIRGGQLAITNLAFSDFSGLQVGVVNYAKTLHGVQIGLVNMVGNTTKGLPIGLLTIVKNGYYALEATSGDVLHANLTYKMGVERFYTLFKTGTAFSAGKTIYSLGLGFGGTVRFGERQGVNIDVSANQIIYNGNWSRQELDLLTKLDLNYRFGISPRISLLVGPSLNGYLTQKTTDGRPGTLMIPYSLFSDESSRTKSYFWIGGNAGIAYSF